MPPLRRLLAAACLLSLAVLVAGCSPAGSGSLADAVPRPALTPVPLPSATAGSTGAPPPDLTIQVLDSKGQPVDRTVDGNALGLSATLSDPAASDVTVTFALADSSSGLGECVVAKGASGCELPLRANGWAWEAQKQVGTRTVTAALTGGEKAEKTVAVVPKPVVLVHGLNSDENSWINWIKPGGYLEAHGMPPYAVDDKQFGTRRMNTGIPSKPTTPTFSISENAEILAEYVEAVRTNTGAERVDLVAHSLGGLISR